MGWTNVNPFTVCAFWNIFFHKSLNLSFQNGETHIAVPLLVKVNIFTLKKCDSVVRCWVLWRTGEWLYLEKKEKKKNSQRHKWCYYSCWVLKSTLTVALCMWEPPSTSLSVCDLMGTQLEPTSFRSSLQKVASCGGGGKLKGPVVMLKLCWFSVK